MTIKNDLIMTHEINKAIIDLAQANNYVMRRNEKRTLENLISALEHIKVFSEDLGLKFNIKLPVK